MQAERLSASPTSCGYRAAAKDGSSPWPPSAISSDTGQRARIAASLFILYNAQRIRPVRAAFAQGRKTLVDVDIPAALCGGRVFGDELRGPREMGPLLLAMWGCSLICLGKAGGILLVELSL